jgi:mitochondrial fission 1 protein
MEHLPQQQELSHPLLPTEVSLLRKEYENNSSTQTKFNYAWGLIRSTTRTEQRQGLVLLEEIYKDTPSRRRECLYYIALAHIKLEQYKEAKEGLDTLLMMEPENKKAYEMREVVKQKIRQGKEY